MKQNLEGMTVIYDVIKKGVFIEFGGTSHFLEGPFPTRYHAIIEAERFCRSLGPSDQAAGILKGALSL